MPKHTIFAFVILASWFMSTCQQDKSRGQTIDYNKLPEIKTNITKEIRGGNEIAFGRLRDLVLTFDDFLLVSDVGRTTIEQFSPKGHHLATIATKGKGPGELFSYFKLIEGTKDRLIVRPYGMSNRIDYYRQNSKGIYTFHNSRLLSNEYNRNIEIIGPFSDSLLYALTSPKYRNLKKYASEKNDYRNTRVAIVNNLDSIVQDSLHTLKIPAPMVDISNNSMNVLGMPPYQYHDRFRVLQGGRYVVAQSDSAVLNFYDANHKLQKRIILNVKDRPVEEADLDFRFDMMNISESKIRKRMEERIPENKPSFLNMWISKQHIWLHVDTTEKGKQIVLLNMEGDPEGTFYLSKFDEIRYIRTNHMYTLHKNPDKGHSIRIYEVDI